MKKYNFDAIQQNMFDSSLNGEDEIKTLKELKKKERNKRAAERRREKKRLKNIENIRRFEQEHPECLIFK